MYDLEILAIYNLAVAWSYCQTTNFSGYMVTIIIIPAAHKTCLHREIHNVSPW